MEQDAKETPAVQAKDLETIAMKLRVIHDLEAVKLILTSGELRKVQQATSFLIEDLLRDLAPYQTGKLRERDEF